MEYIVVSIAALVVAALTLFSGFGLGTLLMPVFALFFPVDVAVAATAVVHLLNNVFKLAIIGRHAVGRVVLLFGLPAAMAAFPGAWMLERMTRLAPLAKYELAGRACEVTVVKLVIATLIVLFALFDILPRLRRISFDRRYVPLGGVLSGFFGGLSGHQGALRAAVLTRLELSSAQFVGTSAVCAMIVDLARLIVYGAAFATAVGRDPAADMHLWRVVAVGSAAAFAGSFVGARLVRKTTIETIQIIVGVMLIAVGMALGLGVI